MRSHILYYVGYLSSIVKYVTKRRLSGEDQIYIRKAKISLLQAMEAPRVARGRGSHIT
jgi:hypothetical protein